MRQDNQRLTPAVADQWFRIFRDILVASVGAFMLVYATVWERPPNEFVIGGALGLFGLIPAIRFDERRRGKDEADAG